MKKIFKYEARTKADGAIVKGELEARNREDVVEMLQGKDLVVVNIKESLGLNVERLKEINIGGVPMKDLVIFMRQLSTMISAGLPLTQAIRILADQAENPKFKKTLDEVLADVEGGSGLAKSFKKTSGIFDEITISLIEAGEESGNLDITLKRLATEMEKKKALQDKIRGAMIYPIIMIVLIIGVVILLVLVLVPAMKDIYSSLGDAELPGITMFFVHMSDFTIAYWPFMIIGILLLIIGGKSILDTPKGKNFVSIASVKAPVFGPLIVNMQIAQFTRILGLLLKSGLSITEALKLSSSALGNLLFRRSVLQAKKQVEKGVPLAVPLARSEVFPLIVSQMVSVGEETGSLDQVLDKMAEFYESEVDKTTDNLSTLMEPILLIFMGGAVGMIAAAVYLPMFNLASNFNM